MIFLKYYFIDLSIPGIIKKNTITKKTLALLIIKIPNEKIFSIDNKLYF